MSKHLTQLTAREIGTGTMITNLMDIASSVAALKIVIGCLEIEFHGMRGWCKHLTFTIQLNHRCNVRNRDKCS